MIKIFYTGLFFTVNVIIILQALLLIYNVPIDPTVQKNVIFIPFFTGMIFTLVVMIRRLIDIGKL